MTKDYVVVTGSVAAGASTLGAVLADLWSADTLFEETIEETNPFFKRAQEDPERWAFTSQVHFMIASAQRHRRLKEMLDAETPASVVLEDRTPFEHTGAYVASLASAGTLPEDEVHLLRQLADEVEQSYLTPAVLIYREMNAEQFASRVTQRGRVGESADFAKLEGIHQAFESFIDGWDRSPLVRIPADLDVLDPAGVREAVELISRVWTPPAV